jgi:hypothetical protein
MTTLFRITEARMCRTSPLVLIGLLTALGFVPAMAQVTARGETASEILEFESPMILDLPLPDVGTLTPDAQRRLPDVHKYVCDDDVSLASLAITKRSKGPKRARTYELVITGVVVVADSYDRRVDIAFRIRSGEETLLLETLHNLKTEEGRATPFRFDLPSLESRLAAASGEGSTLNLELTLTVRPDR